MLCGCGWRSVLNQGHRVGAVAQRRSLNLEHQLVDSEAPVPPHFLSGSGNWNHLKHRQREAVICTCLFHFILIQATVLT